MPRAVPKQLPMNGLQLSYPWVQDVTHCHALENHGVLRKHPDDLLENLLGQAIDAGAVEKYCTSVAGKKTGQRL